LERKKLEAVIYVTCEQLLTPELGSSKEVERAYVVALRRLTWPGLLPFYHALNPEFAERAGL